MMGVFEFVLGVVLISTVGGIINQYLKNQSKHQNSVNSAADERLAELEERVQTLERIVTDSKSALKDKIDAL